MKVLRFDPADTLIIVNARVFGPRIARYHQRDRERAHELRFFAEHLIEDATYRLTVHDVDYLELTDVQLRRGRPG